jgi:hypothetical protein
MGNIEKENVKYTLRMKLNNEQRCTFEEEREKKIKKSNS